MSPESPDLATICGEVTAVRKAGTVAVPDELRDHDRDIETIVNNRDVVTLQYETDRRDRGILSNWRSAKTTTTVDVLLNPEDHDRIVEGDEISIVCLPVDLDKTMWLPDAHAPLVRIDRRAQPNVTVSDRLEIDPDDSVSETMHVDPDLSPLDRANARIERFVRSVKRGLTTQDNNQ